MIIILTVCGRWLGLVQVNKDKLANSLQAEFHRSGAANVKGRLLSIANDSNKR